MCKRSCLLVVIFSAIFALHSVTKVASTARDVHSRIVGGVDARDVDIPFIVSIIWFNTHLCGGSIVNERTVVTAGHCLIQRTCYGLKVHAGTKSQSLNEGVVVKVKAIHIHPQFDNAKIDFDIGFVRLEQALVFGRSIKPVKLPRFGQPVKDNSWAMVAGWGFTKEDGHLSQFLRYAIVPALNHDICRGLPKHRITDNMLCAGFLQFGGIDACQADSGGPLVYNNELIGIVSWGNGCALPGNPGVYSRVAVLRPWVDLILRLVYKEKLE